MWNHNETSLLQSPVEFDPPTIEQSVNPQTKSCFDDILILIVNNADLSHCYKELFTRYRCNLIKLLEESSSSKASENNNYLGNEAVRNLCYTLNSFEQKKIITPGRRSKKVLCRILIQLLQEQEL